METQSEQRNDNFIGTQELMDTLSIFRSTVNRLVKRGMPHIWVGSTKRFLLAKVIEWLKNDQQKI